MNSTPRIFSAIQPTGCIHLGNYLGAIKPWVSLQHTHKHSYQLIYSIADLHALTVLPSPTHLRHNIYQLTATLLAAGISPAHCILFQQSSIPLHAHLAWILACHTPFSKLNSMTQFKEKARSNGTRLGLFAYPTLMAADVLLYKAQLVPVGDDQTQHIEFMRECARTLNSKANKELFPEPEGMYSKACGRVMSLRNGREKMSKSAVSDASRVNLGDSDEMIVAKIRKAKTDAIEGVYWEADERPEVSNLMSIYAELSGKSVEEVSGELEGCSHLMFKERVSEVCVEHLRPIRQEMERLMDDKTYLDSVLEEGRVKASLIAEQTIRETESCLGL